MSRCPSDLPVSFPALHLMQFDVQRMDFNKPPRSQYVIGLWAGAVALPAERQRVKVGCFLPDAMRAEMRGFHRTERPTYNTAEFSQEGPIFVIPDGFSRAVDRAALNLECFHRIKFHTERSECQGLKVPLRFTERSVYHSE